MSLPPFHPRAPYTRRLSAPLRPGHRTGSSISLASSNEEYEVSSQQFPSEPSLSLTSSSRDEELSFSSPPEFVRVRHMTSKSSTEVSEVYDRAQHTHACLTKIPRKRANSDAQYETTQIILSEFQHPGLVRLYSHFQDEEFFYLSTELVSVDLFSLIQQKALSFDEKKVVLYRLVEIVQFLHSKNLVHRDLRIDQVGFQGGDFVHPKILDVKHVLFVKNDHIYYEPDIGDPRSRSPEQFREAQGWELKRGDVWSLGVIAYQLFTGRQLFYGYHDTEGLKRKICRGEWVFPRQKKGRAPLTADLQALISQMLELKPRRRLTAQQALVHPFFVESQDGRSA